MTPPTPNNPITGILSTASPKTAQGLLETLTRRSATRQADFALAMATRQWQRHPERTVNENQVIAGILDAIEISGIDLSDTTSQAEITAVLLAYLAAGHRALHPAGGDA